MEVCCQRMTEGLILPTELKCESRAQIDFDQLQRVCNQVAELAIKLICLMELLERCPRQEHVPGLLERNAVSTQPVVVYVGQERDRRGAITDNQAP